MPVPRAVGELFSDFYLFTFSGFETVAMRVTRLTSNVLSQQNCLNLDDYFTLVKINIEET
jgi:hypothetical protein